MAFVVFIAIVIALIIAVYFFFMDRIDKVAEYRINLINRSRDAAIEDIDQGNYNWRWRDEEFNKVTFSEMTYKFWKPLDSFYPRDPARKER